MHKKSVFITLLVFVFSAALLMGCTPAQNADVPFAGIQTLAFTDTPAAAAEDTAYGVLYKDHHTAPVGQEAEYSAAVPAEAPAAAEPAPAELPAPTEPAATRCPVCYDDYCDDGAYCDDWDDRAENLREAENRKNGTSCPVCGDYDCDDGAYCDDWDEKAENLREEENRKNGIRCPVCGDYDCDDGAYCDDWDDRCDDDRHHGRHHDD